MAPTAPESHQPVLYTSLVEKSQLSHWPKGHQWNATKSQHCQAGLNAPGKGSRANSQHLLHPEPPALSAPENTFHYIQHNSQGAAVAKEDFLPLSARWSLNYASSGTGEEGVDYKAGWEHSKLVLLPQPLCCWATNTVFRACWQNREKDPSPSRPTLQKQQTSAGPMTDRPNSSSTRKMLTTRHNNRMLSLLH